MVLACMGIFVLPTAIVKPYCLRKPTGGTIMPTVLSGRRWSLLPLEPSTIVSFIFLLRLRELNWSVTCPPRVSLSTAGTVANQDRQHYDSLTWNRLAIRRNVSIVPSRLLGERMVRVSQINHASASISHLFILPRNEKSETK